MMYDESAMPEEESSEYEAQMAVLQSFGNAITKLRDEAVSGRAASGIEEEWLEDEEHYEGIDDANRGEMPQKSLSPTGAVRLGGGSAKGSTSGRSTIFLNITRPYVDAASARVCDMLLPTDERNWAMEPTPIPDLVDALESEDTIIDPRTGQPTAAKDAAQEVIDRAKAKADKAQKRIDDWLTECKYHAVVREVIEDSTRIGSGVLKGPIPKKTKRKAMVRTPEGAGLLLTEDIAPRSERVSIWDFFPDPACGEDIRNGKYVFERGELTARQLMDLKGSDYIDEAIDLVLKDGPMSRMSGTTARQEGRSVTEKDRFEVWYFHGYVDAEDMRSAGCDCQEGRQIPAIVTLVNDTVIKATMSPLDSGEFPYDVMVWQRRAGHWAGIGVSRQMRTCQRGVNAASRNLMDNIGRAGRPYTVLRRGAIEPGPDQWTFYASEEADDVRHYMTFFVMPSLQVELTNIIQMFQKFAEDVTGLPMLIQGQLGSSPDTVGGMQMLNNNATSVLRRIARTFDDRVTEPHIERYYEWLLMYGPENDEKGDFAIKARGSTALIERDQMGQAMMGLVMAALNPAYDLDPALVIRKALQAQRIDPTDLGLSEEKKQQFAQMAQQPAPQPAPQNNAVEVAQIREQGAIERKKMDLQAKAAELQAKAAENDLDRRLKQWVAQMDAVIQDARLDADQQGLFERLRADFMRDAMKLRTQRDLTMATQKAPQVVAPPTEPVGRAPDGMAFQL